MEYVILNEEGRCMRCKCKHPYLIKNIYTKVCVCPACLTESEIKEIEYEIKVSGRRGSNE